MPIQPKTGDILIWNSMLTHEVPKQEVDEERIMIAGNLHMITKEEFQNSDKPTDIKL